MKAYKQYTNNELRNIVKHSKQYNKIKVNIITHQIEKNLYFKRDF